MVASKNRRETMREVTAGDIISATFNFVREHPTAVAVWSGVYLAINIAMQIAMRPLLLAQMSGGATATIVNDVLFALLAFFLVFVAIIVLQAAVFRAALYPDRRETGYLRFGMDELRLVGLMIGLGLAIYLALIVAVMIIFGAAAGVFALGGVMRVAGVLLIIGGVFALIAVPIFLVVRLASAGPLTILRGRITVGEAWRLTRGRFWTLFAPYAVVALVWMVATGVIMQLTIGSDVQQAMVAQMLSPKDPALKQQLLQVELEQYGNFGPARWLPLAIGALIGGVLIALQCGSIAIATRLLLEEREPASVF
jgi:hypothetical protein